MDGSPTGGAPTGAAPASAPASAGAASVPTPGPTPTTAGTKASKPRNNSGQFAPKEGAVGATPPETPEDGGKPPEAKEPFRFKKKLKVYGKEEEVDLDEEGLTRELQVSRAQAKKLSQFQATASKAAEILELAEKDPEALLRALGKDPDAYARQKLAREARLGAMTPEERELHELREYKTQQELVAKQREEEGKKVARDQKVEALAKRNEERYMGILQRSGLPQNAESLLMLVEAAERAPEGIEYSEQEIITEAKRRDSERFERSLNGLTGKQLLERLGEKRVQLVLEAAVEKFTASQNFDAPAPAAPPAKEPALESEPLTEAEFNARMRALYAK